MSSDDEGPPETGWFVPEGFGGEEPLPVEADALIDETPEGDPREEEVRDEEVRDEEAGEEAAPDGGSPEPPEEAHEEGEAWAAAVLDLALEAEAAAEAAIGGARGRARSAHEGLEASIETLYTGLRETRVRLGDALAPEERDQVRAAERELRALLRQLTYETIRRTLDALEDDLAALQGVTDELGEAARRTASVREVVEVAADAVTLATALLSGDVLAVGRFLDERS